MKIQNSMLSVEASPLGGELTSVKFFSQELLYQKDGSWPKQDQIAFPLIGTGQRYGIGGVAYCMATDGFAHECDFKSEQASETEMCFELTATKDTHKVYPFSFLLKETLRLEDDVLIREYEVRNLGEMDMPFCLGDRAAFKAPYNKAELEIPPDLTQIYKCPSFFVLRDKAPFPGKGKVLFNKDLLAGNDTLVFDNPKSPLSLSNGNGVIIECRFSSPYVALWTTGKEDDHFLCLESWWGLPQRDDDPMELGNRPAFTVLRPGESVRAQTRYLFILA